MIRYHRRTGPFPFGGRGGGGGAQHLCPNFESLPEKSNMFGAMHFCCTCHGGGGCLEEDNTTLFERLCIEPTEGEGVGVGEGDTFLDFGVLNQDFGGL